MTSKREALTSSDDEEDVAESRRDAKHRRRKELLRSMTNLGKKVDEKLQSKGVMEFDKSTKKKVPATSLATKTVKNYQIQQKGISRNIQGFIQSRSSGSTA